MKLIMMTPDQARFILAHAQEYTSKEFAQMFGIDLFAVRNLSPRTGVKLKREPKRAKIPYTYIKKEGIKEKAFVPDLPKKKIERPPAQYSNSSPYGIASEFRKL